LSRKKERGNTSYGEKEKIVKISKTHSKKETRKVKERELKKRLSCPKDGKRLVRKKGTMSQRSRPVVGTFIFPKWPRSDRGELLDNTQKPRHKGKDGGERRVSPQSIHIEETKRSRVKGRMRKKSGKKHPPSSLQGSQKGSKRKKRWEKRIGKKRMASS